MDGKKLKPILKPKNSKVVDPPRYPNVINGFENQAKRNYTAVLNKTLVELSKGVIGMKTVKNLNTESK